MSAVLNKLEEFTIYDNLENHPAWHGNLPGLYAEMVFKDKTLPYVYMIREGETSSNKNERHYYVSFVLPDQTIKHQPLIIHFEDGQWRYSNGRPRVPLNHYSIDPVMHDIMHCQEGECIPLIKQ